MSILSSSELRAFDATARTGTMTAAARLLGIRQPTVSGHIASLEERFGVELFHRRGRSVELTEFGAMLYEVTNRLYRADEEASALLLSARSQYEGLLKLCAIGPYNVMPALKRFHALYPRVRLSVGMKDSRTIVERILDYQYDLGILLHAVDDERVHCVPYYRQELVVIASLDHPLAKCKTIKLADLHGCGFVLREDGSQTKVAFQAALATQGVQVREVLEVGSREGVREAVAEGWGLGVVSEKAFVPDRRLVSIRVSDVPLHTHVHMICLKERLSAPLIARFLAIIEEMRGVAAPV